MVLAPEGDGEANAREHGVAQVRAAALRAAAEEFPVLARGMMSRADVRQWLLHRADELAKAAPDDPSSALSVVLLPTLTHSTAAQEPV